MTATDTAALAVCATLGILLALSIPEPAETGQKSPPLSWGERSGSGTATGASGAQRRSASEYGASVVVVDGDSLVVDGQKIRIHAIDAPELAQTCRNAAGRSWACGEASAISLRGMVERDPAVTCERKATDRYGRIVAVCRNTLGDLGALQVARGMAIRYERYAGEAYRDEEAAAKAEKLGMHAGTFTNPETWRREGKR